jgi:hypothetical protein
VSGGSHDSRSSSRRCRNQKQLRSQQEPETETTLVPKVERIWAPNAGPLLVPKMGPLLVPETSAVCKFLNKVPKEKCTKRCEKWDQKWSQFWDQNWSHFWDQLWPIFGPPAIPGGSGGGGGRGSWRGGEGNICVHSGSVLGMWRRTLCWPAFVAWGRELAGPVKGARRLWPEAGKDAGLLFPLGAGRANFATEALVTPWNFMTGSDMYD